MAEYYYEVVAKDFGTPDVSVEYKVYRGYRPPGNFVIATHVEIDEYISIIAADDPIITTNKAWWAAHPEDDPGWKQPE